MAIAFPPALEKLRRSTIIEPLHQDPRSVPGRPLGLTAPEAAEVIGWGQADFDEPLREFSAKDRVLLYAYWNQKRHVEEFSEAFRQIFQTTQPTESFIVIDLGCGPFTGGLALAGQLDAERRFDYIGVDRSRTMRQLGERFAAQADRMRALPRIERHWGAEVGDVAWVRPPGWRPVVVIVSFLLASPSLDVIALVGQLDRLLKRLSLGDATLIYTNSPKAGPNRGFPAFRDALTRIGFDLLAADTGSVETERRMLQLRYALFHRRRQRILRLGGG